MALRVITPPALDPISIAEAKSHCRIDHDVDDALVAGWILGARDEVEAYLRRRLMTQTLELVCDRFSRNIEIPIGPVREVTEVRYIDDAGVEQTLLPGVHFQADTDSVIARVVPAYGYSWPTTRPQLNAVTVRFVAGYGSNPGDVPHSIRDAMFVLIGNRSENREAAVIGTISSELPFGVRWLLGPHRLPA